MTNTSSIRYRIFVGASHAKSAGQWTSVLRGAGYEPSESLEGSAGTGFAVALIDIGGASPEAYELIGTLRSEAPDIQVITFSERPNVFEAIEAERRGSFWHFTTPVAVEELLFVVARACIVFELAATNRLLRNSVSAGCFSPYLSGTTVDQVLQEKIERLADVSSTVLITGETGTGKTTLAHLIHERGRRRDGPFICVSCASIPRDLMEAELFGFEKGAFTGAVSARAGSVELANAGTLFLDEIGELPLDLQPKLLSVLQDREVRRLGATRSSSVDVRVIAATNASLESMVAGRTFREDLYYRLNVARLEVKPLRERVSEIGPLSASLLRSLAERLGERQKTLSPGARAALEAYDWPGNIRELQNVLERAALFTTGHFIGVNDLHIPAGQTSEPLQGQLAGFPPLAGYSLEALEREALRQTLASVDGDKKRAAEILGVSLKTVYNKLRFHDLN